MRQESDFHGEGTRRRWREEGKREGGENGNNPSRIKGRKEIDCVYLLYC